MAGACGTRAGLLGALGAVPLLLALAAGPVRAVPDRPGPVSGPDASAAAVRPAAPYGTPVAARDLVPGVPLPDGTADTPDEALPPGALARTVGSGTGAAGAGAAGPADGDAVPGADSVAAARTEFVPADDAAAVRALARSGARTPRDFCSRYTGPYQARIDRELGLPDRPGTPARQSPQHCSAVRRFQRAHHIVPAIGFAGPVTWGAVLDARPGPPPGPGPRCPAAPGRTACVDQDRRLLWVRDGDRVVLGPLRVRTGRPGAATPDGDHRITVRDADHISALYGTPMPWAQYFDGGRAFHGVYGSLYAPTGSCGGVGLRPADARRLWRALRTGDRVRVWGRRPQ